MIEIRGDKKVLITPVSKEDLEDIKIGDIVWLDGDLMTCRDVAHRRLVEYGRELPYDIKDKAIFHAGPIVRKIEGTEDDYEMVSIGPTTSMRMEKFEYEFTEAHRSESHRRKRRHGTKHGACLQRIRSNPLCIPGWLRGSGSNRGSKKFRSITGMSLECRRPYGAIR